MNQNEQYITVMSEVITKQSIILGPDMAIARARKVSEIEISPEGKIIAIKGDPSIALEKLIDTYVELSGQIVKNALSSIFIKYPEVKSQR